MFFGTKVKKKSLNEGDENFKMFKRGKKTIKKQDANNRVKLIHEKWVKKRLLKVLVKKS